MYECVTCVCARALHLRFEPESDMKYYNCIMIIILLLYNACWLISDYSIPAARWCAATDWKDFNIGECVVYEPG